MKKQFMILVSFALTYNLLSCDLAVKQISGKPYEVLSANVFNQLQEKYLINDFELGTAVVSDNYLYGVINSKGKLIQECVYDTIYPLSNNYRIAKVFGKYGLINVNGKVCVECKYDDVGEFVEETTFHPFKLNDKWGFVSKNGEVKTFFKYDEVLNFNDSCFVASLNNKYGVIRYDDTYILEPKYDKIQYKWLGNPYTIVQLSGKMAIVNSVNNFVTGFDYCADDFYSFPMADQYLEVSKYTEYNKKLYGIIEYETGRVVIPCEYESLGDISEGLLYAEKNNLYGFIDINNNVVIPFKYKDAEDFSEGLARVSVHKGYYNSIAGVLSYTEDGYINKQGEFVIKPSIASSWFNMSDTQFNEGLAAAGVRTGNYMFAQKFGYIDKSGKFVIQPEYDTAYKFLKNIAIVEKNKKYGCINKKGELIVNIEYDEYEYRRDKDTVVILKKDGKKCMFNFDGTPVE